jgi:hypothetical protein
VIERAWRADPANEKARLSAGFFFAYSLTQQACPSIVGSGGWRSTGGFDSSQNLGRRRKRDALWVEQNHWCLLQEGSAATHNRSC